jgi:hypothetical protein
MDLKKTRLLFLLTLTIVFINISCNKKVVIKSAELQVVKSSVFTAEDIELKLVLDGKYKKKQAYAENIKWIVSDETGKSISIKQSSNSNMIFVAEKPYKYSIEAKITYPDKSTATVTKSISVFPTIDYIKQNWKGEYKGNAISNDTQKVLFKIIDQNTYSAINTNDVTIGAIPASVNNIVNNISLEGIGSNGLAYGNISVRDSASQNLRNDEISDLGLQANNFILSFYHTYNNKKTYYYLVKQ